jgi:hypothetical protein
MQGLFVFFHWETLNRRFGIRARHKSLSHDFRDINDMRDLISFPWSLSQVQIGLDKWTEGVLFKCLGDVMLNHAYDWAIVILFPVIYIYARMHNQHATRLFATCSFSCRLAMHVHSSSCSISIILFFKLIFFSSHIPRIDLYPLVCSLKSFSFGWCIVLSFCLLFASYACADDWCE